MPRLAGPASGAGLSPDRTGFGCSARRLDPAQLPPSGWAGPAAGALVAAEPFTDGPPVAL